MARNLPSLNTLRTFEAAARLGSFSAAGRELSVTPGAVSRAIQSLEEWLSVELFSRRGRRVELTDAGRDYMREIGAAFDRLTLATARLMDQREHGVLRVDALPTLTMRWLIPRLPRFQLRAPGVEIRLTTSDHPLAPESGFDVAIRRGPGPWPGLRATHFLEESVTPVGAPSLLAKARLKNPRELATLTWLSADTRQDLWPEWLRAHAAASVKPQRTLRFDHYYLALQAAQDGLGVAMGSLTVLGEDLRAGRLAAPFPELQVRARTYHALYHPRRSSTVTKFVAWLQEEGASA